jgi:hypothetical protein
MEPFPLPCDKAGEDALRTGALHCLASPGGLMLIWCDGGPLWSWPSAVLPAAPRQIELPRGASIVAAAWLDNRTVAVADTQGEILTSVLPATAQDLPQQWRHALKWETPVRAVAGWLDGARVTLAVATDKRILIQEPGSALRREGEMESPALCMQFLSKDTVFAATRKSLSMVLPGNARALLQLREEYAAGAVARGAACCVLVLAERSDEVHLFEFDAATQKASCTRLAGPGAKDVSCVAVAAAGKLVAIGSKDGAVTLMGGAPFKILARVTVRSKPVRAVELSNDGHTLYAIDQGGSVYAWTAAGIKP